MQKQVQFFFCTGDEAVGCQNLSVTNFRKKSRKKFSLDAFSRDEVRASMPTSSKNSVAL
jgi:hypothetical protein